MTDLLTLPTLMEDNKYKDDMVLRNDDMYFVAEDDYNGLRIADTFLGNVTLYDLSTVAKQQLCNTLGIPQQYFDRCPDWLRKQNVDYHLSQHPKRMMARTYKEHPKKGNVVRGLLSEKYGIIDYAPTVQAINNVVGTGLMKDPHVMRDHYEDSILRIHVVDKGAEVMEGSFSGVLITNSELGLHKLDASFGVYTLACSNGLVIPRMVTGFSRRHIGNYKTLNQDLYNAIKEFDNIQNKVSSMLNDSNKCFIEKENAIKYINDLREFPLQWRKDMVDRINNRGVKTRAWHICYDMTQLAQSYSENTRMLIEQEAGSFLVSMCKN